MSAPVHTSGGDAAYERYPLADLLPDQDLDHRAADVFDRLATFVVGEHSLQGSLQLVVDLAASALSGVDGVGITLMKKGKYLTAVSTTPKVVELDQLQYDLKAGPCLQAIRDAEMQLTRSLLIEDRWPEYASKALYAGAMSILAIPIEGPGEVLGAINFYSSRENAFTDNDIAIAKSLNARSSVVLINVKRYEESTELAAQLQEALQSRAVIDQAKGVLMATEHLSADEAFEKLKALSQRVNIKVRDLATGIVGNVTAHEGSSTPGVTVSGLAP